MFTQEFINNLKTKKGMIVLVILGAIILSLVFSFVQTFEYECETSVYVIQNQEGLVAKDAYAAAKSAEKLAKNMSSMIYTSTFMERVFETNYGVDRNILPTDEIKKRKEWSHKIETSVVAESGILNIKVYDKDKAMAEKIAQVIIYVLVTDGQDFHGGGNDVEVRIADAPIVSKYPARPNILINAGIGLILGLIIALIIVLITTEETISRDPHFVDGYNRENNNLGNLNLIKNQLSPLAQDLGEMNRKLDFLANYKPEIDYDKINQDLSFDLAKIKNEIVEIIASQKDSDNFEEFYQNVSAKFNELKQFVAQNSLDKNEINSLIEQNQQILDKLNGLNQNNNQENLAEIVARNSLNKNDLRELILQNEAILGGLNELSQKPENNNAEKLNLLENQNNELKQLFESFSGELENLSTKDNIRLTIRKNKEENLILKETLAEIMSKIENLPKQPQDDDSLVLEKIESIRLELAEIKNKKPEVQENSDWKVVLAKLDEFVGSTEDNTKRLNELAKTGEELDKVKENIDKLAQNDIKLKKDIARCDQAQQETASQQKSLENKYDEEAERIRQNLSQIQGKMINFVTQDKLDSLNAKQNQYLSKDDLRRLIGGDSAQNTQPIARTPLEEKQDFRPRIN